jgi:putative restriction endonuclease
VFSFRFEAENMDDQLNSILLRVAVEMFRRRVMVLWKSCAVSGIADQTVLTVCHIKPMERCSDRERFDPYNGIVLHQHPAAMFNGGYVTFQDDGSITLSPDGSENDLKRLGVTVGMRLKHVFEKNKPYLDYHREHVFNKPPAAPYSGPELL